MCTQPVRLPASPHTSPLQGFLFMHSHLSWLPAPPLPPLPIIPVTHSPPELPEITPSSRPSPLSSEGGHTLGQISFLPACEGMALECPSFFSFALEGSWFENTFGRRPFNVMLGALWSWGPREEFFHVSSGASCCFKDQWCFSHLPGPSEIIWLHLKLAVSVVARP